MVVRRDRKRVDDKVLKVALSLAAFMVLLSFFLVLDFALVGDRIHPRITLAGVPVGGKTKKEVLKEMNLRASEYMRAPITLRRLGKEFRTSPNRLGARADVAGSIDRVYNLGRNSGFLDDVLARLIIWVMGEDVPLSVRLQTTDVTKGIASINAWIGRLPRDATVEKNGRTFNIRPSKAGITVDRFFLLDKLTKDVGDLKEINIEAKTIVWQPDITDDEAREAASKAPQDCSSPLGIKFAEKEIELDSDRLWELLTFDKVRFRSGEVFLAPSLEKQPTLRIISNFLNQFEKEAVDARFEVDGPDVNILPGREGKVADLTSSYIRLVENFRDNDGKRSANAEMKVVKPKTSARDLASMHVETRLSSYSTEFDSSNTPRVNNIGKVAAELDGTIIDPGVVFSFNRVTGPRTKEQGYEEAPVIVRGVLRPGVGGGVCQVATTVFNAIFFAGLPIIERHPHYFYISHYPAGRDAAVYFGGYDLRCRNDTTGHLLIKAFASGSSITVSIYGRKPKRTITFKASDFFDFVNPSTRLVNDATLVVGTKKEEQSSERGRSIIVKRTVSVRRKILRKDEFYSRYSPKDSIVKVGTRPKIISSQSLTPATRRTPTVAGR